MSTPKSEKKDSTNLNPILKDLADIFEKYKLKSLLFIATEDNGKELIQHKFLRGYRPFMADNLMVLQSELMKRF